MKLYVDDCELGRDTEACFAEQLTSVSHIPQQGFVSIMQKTVLRPHSLLSSTESRIRETDCFVGSPNRKLQRRLFEEALARPQRTNMVTLAP